MQDRGGDDAKLAEALLELLPGLHKLGRGHPPEGEHGHHRGGGPDGARCGEGSDRARGDEGGHHQHAGPDGAGDGQGGRGFRERGGQFRLLRVLQKRGRVPMQELAAHLDVAPPTATGVVKRLLEQGYVERVRDDADWRTVWVELTDQGREAVVRHHRERVEAIRGRIERLDEGERATLRDALPVLARLLETRG